MVLLKTMKHVPIKWIVTAHAVALVVTVTGWIKVLYDFRHLNHTLAGAILAYSLPVGLIILEIATLCMPIGNQKPKSPFLGFSAILLPFVILASLPLPVMYREITKRRERIEQNKTLDHISIGAPIENGQS